MGIDVRCEPGRGQRTCPSEQPGELHGCVLALCSFLQRRGGGRAEGQGQVGTPGSSEGDRQLGGPCVHGPLVLIG